jgi:hypothetical protein
VGTHWNRPKKETKIPHLPPENPKEKKTKAPLTKPSQWLDEISI